MADESEIYTLERQLVLDEDSVGITKQQCQELVKEYALINNTYYYTDLL